MNNRALRLINSNLETICYLEITDTVKDGVMVVSGSIDGNVFNLLGSNGVDDLLKHIETKYGYIWNSIKSPRLPNQAILESLRLESMLINQDDTAPDNIIMLFSR